LGSDKRVTLVTETISLLRFDTHFKQLAGGFLDFLAADDVADVQYPAAVVP